MKTTFLRLLKAEDKEAALREAVGSVRSGGAGRDTVFSLEAEKFSKVPNSPFAYWVDDEIRELFTKFPPFESEGRTVRVGLQTGDDFRFVRAWWEVKAERRLDAGNGPDWRADLPAFQAWCRKRTHEGKYWAPFAKGGEYSPYYADIHLVVNWKDEGEDMKAFSGSVIRNESFYFRPGVTWPVRTDGLSFRAFPAGSIFGHKGSVLFSENTPELSLINTILNLKFEEDLAYVMGVGREEIQSYEVGIIKNLIFPDILISNFDDFSRKGAKLVMAAKENDPTIRMKRVICLCNDISNIRQSLIKVMNDSENALLNSLKIKSFSNSVEPRKQLLASITRWEKEALSHDLIIDDVVSLIFGRFDIRIAKDSSLAPALPDPFDPLPVCPPAMLVGTDGLPARQDDIASEDWLRARPNAITLPPASARSGKITAAEYPIEVPWDGILVDDPDDPRDIVARLRSALRFLHGEEADEKERELRAELGVNDLRDYLRKPGGFFESHLKRYSKSRRKAPVYWPLQSADGRYTLWLYYPRLTADTLYACSNLLEEKLKLERRKLETARQDLARSEGKADRLRTEELVEFTAALAEMKEEIDRVAGLPFKPDLDDGVQIAACPLWRLFRLPSWRKELEATWKKLEAGDYDWAHLAYAVWPDRVREKCRRDRSLAVAHGLEDLCEWKPPAADKKGKKAGKGKAVVESELELETDED